MLTLPSLRMTAGVNERSASNAHASSPPRSNPRSSLPRRMASGECLCTASVKYGPILWRKELMLTGSGMGDSDSSDAMNQDSVYDVRSVRRLPGKSSTPPSREHPLPWARLLSLAWALGRWHGLVGRDGAV